jgi:hypothetical protein
MAQRESQQRPSAEAAHGTIWETSPWTPRELLAQDPQQSVAVSALPVADEDGHTVVLDLPDDGRFVRGNA